MFGDLQSEVSLEELATQEGAIKEVFEDGIDELDVEAQQVVFESLLQYNMMYLEEQA